MKKIVALTGSRGEWGYIRPILRLIDADPDLEYGIIATNMHLLPAFGMSVNEIRKDGFTVDEEVFMTYDGYTGATMAKSLGALLLELPTVLRRMRPDFLLLAGDRGEQLVGALAAAHLGVAVAHIQAGELSGNVDGIIRHAITKIAHIHFAANESFAERVRRMGEEPWRVVVSGAPLVDELVKGMATPRAELCRKYRLPADGDTILSVQHPVTEEEGMAGDQIEETLSAIDEIGWPTTLIYPNGDAGSESIRVRLSKFSRANVRHFRNLPREDYVGLMQSASVIVGNSSSGIMEAPSFGTPCVNIGRRQNGRPQAENVINVGYDRREIAGAIRQATTPEFRARARGVKNPYGDGTASERIVRTLKTVEVNGELLMKQMTY